MTDEKQAAPSSPGCFSRLIRYFVLVLVLGAVVVLIDAFRVTLPLGIPGTPAKGETIGAIHIHTNVSRDGGGDIDDVVAAAKWADLSFVVITDHNQTTDPEIAGTDRNSVLIVGGEEVSTPNGHFLAIGATPGWRKGVPKDTRALLAAAGKAGAARFVAHPTGARKDWTDWETDDFEGIEIWNGDAEWRDNNPAELLMAALTHTVNPDLALVRLADRPDDNLRIWDGLLEKRQVAGLCGTDAHAHVPIAFGYAMNFPAYLRVFRLARQHVLLPPGTPGKRGPRDAGAVVKALKEGRSFCALDGLSVASGFVTRIEGEGLVAGPGQSLPWSPGTSIRVSIPPASGRPFIKVYKDGVETFSSREWRLDADVPGPGRYRVEVWLRQPGLTGGQRWTPWILSNPIDVTAGVTAGTAAP